MGLRQESSKGQGVGTDVGHGASLVSYRHNFLVMTLFYLQ